MFGGGTSRFQPVYVDDLAQAVEIITRNDAKINKMVSGKYIEAGGLEGTLLLVRHSSHTTVLS